ncbi:thioredoxin family protein [Sutcliffiella cohnii]|uniref:Thiol reductase thioredoxin n=1 Tax=Sutcliffiella cohnii TaxID=33932 RepID=A0A223KTR9_9BACI|nr:thioredoxin family protein [Sutcliffiella cohnii]AST92891.1 thiol reductase thioredoxin [Sutcliffiella cohnii]MED4016152.1 thioredoxin family protein [Sutcliffiella cohnii]
MEKLQSVEQFSALRENEDVVFMFSASWCPDCVFVEPFLPEIMEKFNIYTFIYVDRDEYIDLCVEQNIFGIPSFLVFKNGEEAGRFVSKDRKTKEEIESFLTSLV